jgi:hypothetical protein
LVQRAAEILLPLQELCHLLLKLDDFLGNGASGRRRKDCATERAHKQNNQCHCYPSDAQGLPP